MAAVSGRLAVRVARVVVHQIRVTWQAQLCKAARRNLLVRVTRVVGAIIKERRRARSTHAKAVLAVVVPAVPVAMPPL